MTETADWNPIEQPKRADRIILAGEASPGIAVVDRSTLERDYDERRGVALSGARLRYRGVKLIRPKVSIKLYSVDDWNRWNVWKRLLARAPDGSRPHALDIEHPSFAEVGVTAVVIWKHSPPVRTSNDGEWTAEIEMIEHRPPQPVDVGIDGSESDQGDDNPEVGRLRRELDALVIAGEDLDDLGAAALGAP